MGCEQSLPGKLKNAIDGYNAMHAQSDGTPSELMTYRERSIEGHRASFGTGKKYNEDTYYSSTWSKLRSKLDEVKTFEDFRTFEKHATRQMDMGKILLDHRDQVDNVKFKETENWGTGEYQQFCQVNLTRVNYQKIDTLSWYLLNRLKFIDDNKALQGWLDETYKWHKPKFSVQEYLKKCDEKIFGAGKMYLRAIAYFPDKLYKYTCGHPEDNDDENPNNYLVLSPDVKSQLPMTEQELNDLPSLQHYNDQGNEMKELVSDDNQKSRRLQSVMAREILFFPLSLGLMFALYILYRAQTCPKSQNHDDDLREVRISLV